MMGPEESSATFPPRGLRGAGLGRCPDHGTGRGSLTARVNAAGLYQSDRACGRDTWAVLSVAPSAWLVHRPHPPPS